MPDPTELEEMRRELEETYENVSSVTKMIEVVEAVPEWPITAGGVGRMAVTAVLPTLGNLIIGLLPGQTGLTLTDVLKDAIPDVMKGLFN